MTLRTRKRASRADRRAAKGYLDGQLLIAMPSMPDDRFSRTVIYMCAHTADGAMGLVINQRRGDMTFSKLMSQLELLQPGDEDALSPKLLDMEVFTGGPVETKRGFVLHTPDYHSKDSTLVIDEAVSLTATLDILKAIAAGRGPKHAILALGYASWSAGQLDTEMSCNGWLHCPADDELIFHTDIELKYELAMSRLGIDLSHLVSEAGHA